MVKVIGFITSILVVAPLYILWLNDKLSQFAFFRETDSLIMRWLYIVSSMGIFIGGAIIIVMLLNSTERK